jgi:hypothetical protein
MPISDDLGRVLQDINGMMRAVVSSQSQLEDPTVRRTLTFLSQVILVVEQAFEDILTVLVDIQFLEDSPSLHTELRVLRKRVELLTARSYYRDAAEICSRLKHLRENYDNFIRPAVRHLPGFSDWQGLFGLIEEREGRIISLVERTAGHLALLLSQAESGDLAPLKTYSSQQTADLRSILSDLHTLNSRILGFSGNAGFLELTRDRNTLEREVNQVHVYQGEVNMGSRYQVGDVGAGARVAVGEHISWAEGVPKLPDGEELKHQFDALLERIATDSSLDEDTRELARTKTEAVAEGLVVAQASPGVLRRALLDAKSWFGGAASGIGLALSGILKSEAAQKTLGTVTEATTKAAIASFIG